MIVKNEAPIIAESLESTAPFIDYWVIVDTGSTDDTREVIRTTMARLGIPGELHERPWRDFGHNRTEALRLAQGHCDYVLVNDADDVLTGTPDFSGLTADGYFMLMDSGVVEFWQLHLFRDGLPWRYRGSTHEFAACDDPHTTERLGGDHRILYRQIGGNSMGADKLERDRDMLLAEIERDPDNSRPVFYLALTYRAMGDYAEARRWWAQRAGMGGFDEEVYYAKLKLAEAMDRLGEPWPRVQEAYLEAWAFRPTRAEALYEIATHHRRNGDYELGYLFAARGAQIPLPESDVLFVQNDVHEWRLLDEQAVCASWIDRAPESLRLVRRLLRRGDVPDDDRQRLLENRDLLASQARAAGDTRPDRAVRRPVGRPDAEVTVSVTAGRDRAATERTLNSFLNCCTDAARVGRFLVIDDGLSDADRTALAQDYPMLDLVTVPGANLDVVRSLIGGRYWLHLWHGWRFITEEAIVDRLVDVLETEPGVCQVGVNLGDADRLGPQSPARDEVRVTPRGGHYLLSDSVATGPAMFDMTRVSDIDFRVATLDEVLCVRD